MTLRRVLISSYLEPALVARIAVVDEQIEVLYAPELLPVPRYVADHHGSPRQLTPAQLERWRHLLADISFDFDWWQPANLTQHAPHLRWVQATSSGIGQFMQRTGLDTSGITVTTAAGIHAAPLAEFALLGVLSFIKELPMLRCRQTQHHWERYTARQLAGQRVVVVGLGQVGKRAAGVFAALGAEVWGVGRDDGSYDLPVGQRMIGMSELDQALAGAGAVVLCCPLTPKTEGLLDERRLRLLPPGAVVVNIARGPVIDEPGLIRVLEDGHLGGACLDVFAQEPLPADSPLWDMDRVIVSPHSASTVAGENEALTTLFCDNLQRWLAGRPLRNLYHPERGY